MSKNDPWNISNEPDDNLDDNLPDDNLDEDGAPQEVEVEFSEVIDGDTEGQTNGQSSQGQGASGQGASGQGATGGQTPPSLLSILFGQGASGQGSAGQQGSEAGGQAQAGFAGAGGDGPQIPKFKDMFNFEVPSFLKGRSRKFLTVFGIICAIVILFLYWWFHPALNLHSKTVWYFIAIVLLLPCWITFRGASTMYSHSTSKRPAKPKQAKTYRKISWVPVVIALIGVLGAVFSMAWVPGNSGKYANILKTTEMDFATDIEEVNYSEIPIIDKNSAVLLGNRAMGTIADYVSQFEISSLYSQINYQGTPVRVSPLEYANIIKWINNYSGGIPAYCIVDMTTQETEIVRTSKPIKYVSSDPLFRNIERHVQLKYPTYMFDEFAFEIDEEGNPYWVCPVQKMTIGLFGGTTIQKVVLCDACTGDCEVYNIEDCPSWVDRAYPSELLVQQYNWSGLYINGWFNSWLGQDGVKKTTPGTTSSSASSLGYNYIAKDDDVWLYTGVTSATSDDSIIGFVLVNQRTAESHFYSVSGATEESAMSSAEGLVQAYEYVATFPLLLNVSGQPTYFMALKDAAGLAKQFAMINVRDYNVIFATGATVAETQKSYKASLAANGVDVSTGSSGDELSVSGKIHTMYQVPVDDDMHFYFTIEDKDKIYDCPISVIDIVKYTVGDSIKFKCYEGDPTCTVTEIEAKSSTESGS